MATLLLAAALAGCSCPARSRQGARTVALPRWAVAACASVPGLRASCVDRQPPGQGDAWSMEILRARPGSPVSYVVLRNGSASVIEAAGAPRPIARAFRLSHGQARRWGGLNGRLFRTPTTRRFGALVAFAWMDGSVRRVVALDAFVDAVATLRAIVGRRPMPQAIRELVPSRPVDGVAMVETPRWVSLLCRQQQRRGCPARLPRPGSAFTLVQVAAFRGGRSLDVAWGGAASRPSRNRPPRLVHLTVSDGHRPPGPARPRRALGTRRWTATPGTLSLGDRDCFGDHVCYRWREGGRGRLISIHAWSPLGQALAVFAAVVRSTARRRA